MAVTLMLLMMGVGFALVAGGGDGDVTAEPQEPQEPQEPPEPDDRPVTTLTEGDDEIRLTPVDQIEGGQVLLAGAGDDFIFAEEGVSALEAFGQAGDDVFAVGDSTVHGGEGDDRLYIRGASGIGYGDAGNDTLEVASDGEGTVFGGEGNDSLTMVGGFGELNGDGGNDTLLLNGLGTANGGAGDDFIEALFFNNVTPQELAEHGPVELTGGEGADRFGLAASSATQAIVNITDFNPEEDFLVFAVPVNVQSALGYEITVTQDPEADTTTVTLTRGGLGAAGTAVLAGMPDVSAEDVGLVRSLQDFELAEPGTNFGVVIGTFGDDMLEGASGDTVIGGNGDDVISVVQDVAIASSVEAGAGDDMITGNGGGAFFADAGAGNDTVSVAAGSSASIQGGEGNDVLSYATGPNSAASQTFGGVDGGAGDDTITVGDVTSASVSLGDGDDLATVGEGVRVVLNGDGTDTVNLELSSDPTEFPTLEAYIGNGALADYGSTFGGSISNGEAQDTINISVADPDAGSYHIIRSFYTNYFGPEAPQTVAFMDVLVWSADADANVDDIDYDGLLNGTAVDSGFHVLTSYDVGVGSIGPTDQVDNDTPSTDGPEVQFNFTVSSVTSELQEYISDLFGT